MKTKKFWKNIAKHVYTTLGPGHAEAIYRDAMSVELQDEGYRVKTEAPVSIKYKTKKGNEMIVGGGRIDPYVSKGKQYAVVELKASGSLLGNTEDKNKPVKKEEDLKEYKQLAKYLQTLGRTDTGVLINFPWPPTDEPEVIMYKK